MTNYKVSFFGLKCSLAVRYVSEIRLGRIIGIIILVLDKVKFVSSGEKTAYQIILEESNEVNSSS